MFLDPKGNQFKLRFPKHFFSKDISEKYERYLKDSNSSIIDCHEMMNNTMQSVTFPALTIPGHQQQTTGTRYQPIYPAGSPITWFIDRQISVKFKLIEGYLNYWFILENIFDFYNKPQRSKDEEFLPSLNVEILDSQNNKIGLLRLDKLIYKSIDSPITFDYSNVRNSPSSFTISFTWNDINLDFLNNSIIP